MKKLLPSATALVSLTVGAMAADLPSRRAAPAPAIAAVPLFTWTGFYVGMNGGGAWSDSEVRSTPNASTFVPPLDADDVVFYSGRLSSDEAGFTGGGQIGYNFQFGSFVAGAEADINVIDIDSKQFSSRTDVFFILQTALRHQVEWFGTARGRVGFALDRLLVYATGGAAFGEVKSSLAAITDPAEIVGFTIVYRGSNSDTRVGWTVGAGAEYALLNNLTLKAEYLYVDLGDKAFAVTAGGANPPFPGSTIAVRDETKFHIARAGVNWKF